MGGGGGGGGGVLGGRVTVGRLLGRLPAPQSTGVRWGGLLWPGRGERLVQLGGPLWGWRWFRTVSVQCWIAAKQPEWSAVCVGALNGAVVGLVTWLAGMAEKDWLDLLAMWAPLWLAGDSAGLAAGHGVVRLWGDAGQLL